MCVGGCPDKCSAFEGAERIALFALDLIELTKRFRTDNGSQITIRAGIHSGAVVAGVIEKKRPQYTLFGDAVIVASSMETHSEAMKVQCSHVSSHLLKSAPNYRFSLVENGIVELTEQGRFKTFFIERADKYIE
jgi:class 3 adenylate cyclase